MADQTVAGDLAVTPSKVRRGWPANKMLRKVARGWNASGWWARWLLGQLSDVPSLADFVVANHVFRATQQPEELAALGGILASRRLERVLEIGTCHGGTLFFIAQLASANAKIGSVDLPGGKFGGGYGPARAWCYKRFARAAQEITLLRGDSHNVETLHRVKEILRGQRLDYLFIDGDHRYQGVKQDFEMYGPLVGPGGLIAFHDIVDGPPDAVGGVPEFWREVKRGCRSQEFVLDPKQGGLGIGLLYVD